MKKPVMVVGGGIAGIQASTDLADMGIPVFLVESSPSIGGRMAQLDKTFPTNDCSACILAPKVTSCFTHPLVKTFTLSDLVEIKGEAPEFTAVVRKRPRYIDEEKCKGCDDCMNACPIQTKSEFDMGIGSRKAVYKPFAQAVPNKAAIDKKGTSPCKYECPANLDAHGYVSLIGEGRYEDALKVVRRTTPFAGVLGRVCLHPCEQNCSRQYVEESVSICSLKRFIADDELKKGIKPAVALREGLEEKSDKIAIIGAGPAGLNCAYQLALKGYKPTVFEALPVAGGMLKVGIPDYRLDKDVLKGEIELIENMGVEIRLNARLGRDFTLDQLKAEGYKAFFLAIGAHKDMKMGVPGEEGEGVLSSVDFLRELNLGNTPSIGKKTLVIGGGNVAMDAARSALRLGSDVTVVYRRTEEEMPANPWEVEHAMEEGVRFAFLTTQTEVIFEDGKMKGLNCLQNELGEPDASGRRRPVPIEGSDFIMEADTIIAAIGQYVDGEEAKAAGFDVFNERGDLAADRKTMALRMEGVFTGGDAMRGPATMIEAVADGNRVAKAIINYLEGANAQLEPFLLPQTPLEEIDTRSAKRAARAKMPMLDMRKRRTSFEEVELGLDEETAKAEALRCVDCSVCCDCRMCEEACGSDAIFHEQEEEMIEIPVSSVILAPGYDVSSDIPPELGYTRYEDVVTSLEYERILSASGPFQGHVQRPSDGKAPERIAFIQCVGSRDHQCNADYCSAVCCMYAVKEAEITKEHLTTVKDIDIYYMDMRAYGKDFDKYVDNAKTKYGIHFIRSRVAETERDEATGNIILKSCDESGAYHEAAYDMVVLSVGIVPNRDNVELLHKLQVKTDRYGFIWTNEMTAPLTSRNGVMACGAAAGPKDIPETVIEASAAAASAAKIANRIDVDLYREYAAFFQEEPEVPMRDVSKEPIRIGVFVCHCGVNIGGYLTVKEVVEYARTLPFVAFAEEGLYTCSVDFQKVISDKILEYNLNRVVVASCTPRTHEPLFQNVLRKSGLNPYLFSMANIRDQCSWVHMDDYARATQKAKELVRMAVGKVTFAKQLSRKKMDVNKDALVIGGGIAGLSAAHELSGMGYHVHIVEKADRLGGKVLNLDTTMFGRPLKGYVDNFVLEAMLDPNISVHLRSQIKDLSGFVGNFVTVIETAPEEGAPDEGHVETEIQHGVVIVAVGASERKPDTYLYGKSDKVLTQLEFEKKRRDGAMDLSKIRSVVMIQCVGSREPDRPYCSRVCCNHSIKNAILLKETDPSIQVTVLYREIRSYGLNEAAYRQARQLGVQFVRYEDDIKPTVTKQRGGRLSVTSYDPLLTENVSYDADLVLLASAIEPDADGNKVIAQMLKIPMTQEGFFLEAHAKLRPVDFATEGVYLCGLAHNPKSFKESIIQGKAAASRAGTIISKDFLESEGAIATVDQELCSACGNCEQVCAYKAVEVEDVVIRRQNVRKAVINDVLCKGCGTCSAICRCGAIDVNGFSDKQVINEIEYLLRGGLVQDGGR
ncbi:MAG: FAD-dependent oxidoreductase [Clostridiales bacterium]|nr:FAD-dependent oxidoreductase [Clostridiales bacterium]